MTQQKWNSDVGTHIAGKSFQVIPGLERHAVWFTLTAPPVFEVKRRNFRKLWGFWARSDADVCGRLHLWFCLSNFEKHSFSVLCSHLVGLRVRVSLWLFVFFPIHCWSPEQTLRARSYTFGGLLLGLLLRRSVLSGGCLWEELAGGQYSLYQSLISGVGLWHREGGPRSDVNSKY